MIYNNVNCDKKVSLVVAIYNSELFLPKLLSSIKNQTYENLEVILVDDGSPDNSGRICDEYASVDERFIVIHKKNGGTCDARNAGLKRVTGFYLMIIDGDDWLEEDYVEYLVNIAEITQSDMALSTNVFTTRDRRQIDNDKIEVWSSERATAAIIYPYFTLGPWNKIYSTRLIKEHNIDFSVPWFGEGLYFASTASQYANHIGVGHKKVYNYRLNNTGSGLTVYKVQNGINALANIKQIQSNLYLKSKMVDNAVKWHIWKNYTFLLLQIIGTKSETNYKEEFDRCVYEIKNTWVDVFFNSEVSKKEKIKILICGIFPVWYSKLTIWKKNISLKKDLDNIEESL